MTMDEFENLLRTKINKPKEAYFSACEKSIDDALMLLYLNSGGAQFDEYKEFTARAGNNDDINIKDLARKVKAEILTPSARYKKLKDFFGQHPYADSVLLACGACSLRHFASSTDKKKEYKKVRLCDLPEPYMYSEEERNIHEQRLAQSLIVADKNRDGVMIERVIHPFKAVSAYFDANQDTWYHLHPELVCTEPGEGHDNETGDRYTFLCRNCHNRMGNCSRVSIPLPTE